MKIAGFTGPQAVLLLTKEWMASGRCFNPDCHVDHTADLVGADVAVLMCPHCALPALTAYHPARARLVVGCPPCGVQLAIVELPAQRDVLERIDRETAGRVLPRGASS